MSSLIVERNGMEARYEMILRTRLFLSLLAVFLLIMTVACQQGDQAHSETEKTVRINDPASWVVKTIPADNDRNVASNIKTLRIEFDRDMDPNSLTPNSITIIEGKHDHMLQELYTFIYDSTARTLTLSTKDSQFSFGSSNYIDITLSKDIKNIKGEKMGVNVQFGFAVPSTL
jgi:hypothetical protein